MFSRILGIDPGLKTTGYGVIDARGSSIKLCEAGIINTSCRDKLQDRLIQIHNSLSGLIEDISPQVAVIEKLYSHYKHPTTSVLMAHARGAAYVAISQKGLPIFEYPVKRIKKAIAGRGNATKDQVGKMVQAYLDLKKQPDPLDVSDALALAIAHVFITKRQIL